ncbi:MAG: hypothetical protein ACREDU_02345, partial [Methylocella sp.]
GVSRLRRRPKPRNTPILAGHFDCRHAARCDAMTCGIDSRLRLLGDPHGAGFSAVGMSAVPAKPQG